MANAYDAGNKALIERVRQDELRKAEAKAQRTGVRPGRGFGLPRPWSPPVPDAPIRYAAPQFGLDPEAALALLTQMTGGGLGSAAPIKPMASHQTSAALLSPTARKQVRGAAKPKSIDDKMARATLQTAGVPMPEFDAAAFGSSLGPLNFGQDEALESIAAAGAPQQAPLESSPLPEGLEMELPESPEGVRLPPADKKRSAILRALMMGIGR